MEWLIYTRFYSTTFFFWGPWLSIYKVCLIRVKIRSARDQNNSVLFLSLQILFLYFLIRNYLIWWLIMKVAHSTASNQYNKPLIIRSFFIFESFALPNYREGISIVPMLMALTDNMTLIALIWKTTGECRYIFLILGWVN